MNNIKCFLFTMFVHVLYIHKVLLVSQDLTPSPLSNKAREMRKVIGTCARVRMITLFLLVSVFLSGNLGNNSKIGISIWTFQFKKVLSMWIWNQKMSAQFCIAHYCVGGWIYANSCNKVFQKPRIWKDRKYVKLLKVCDKICNTWVFSINPRGHLCTLSF